VKNMVAPTCRSAGAELKLSATTHHQPDQRPRGHFLSTCQRILAVPSREAVGGELHCLRGGEVHTGGCVGTDRPG
jgi:hypothetical protein